jgi:hypothetical protein
MDGSWTGSGLPRRRVKGETVAISARASGVLATEPLVGVGVADEHPDHVHLALDYARATGNTARIPAAKLGHHSSSSVGLRTRRLG